jgi:sugar-specific transcriptional regulator TrmB
MRSALKQIGLTDGEINIYLCLLQGESLNVTQIARRLNLARTTVYRFIDSLHEKGLVNEILIKDTKTYSPLPPEQLPRLMQSKIAQIEEIVPQLKNMTKKEQNITVALYRGSEGIKIIMEDILDTNKEYTTLGAIEKYFENLDLYTKIWMRKAEEKKLKGKLLNYTKTAITKYETLKKLPKSLISKITTVTYGDKTAIFIWSKPHYVILINDKEVTDSNKKVFETLWLQATKK